MLRWEATRPAGGLSNRRTWLYGEHKKQTDAASASVLVEPSALRAVHRDRVPRPRLVGVRTDRGQETKHPSYLGRRHRHLEYQPQQPWHDGIPDAEHRPRKRGKGWRSPTTTPSNLAQPAVQLSSAVACPFAVA